MSARLLACVLGLAAVLASLCGSTAHATQILAQAIPELGRDARLVVQARVVDQRAFWNDSRTRIVTAIELEVDATFKGDPPARVTVVQAGGELDGIRMTVHGVTTWKQDERVLVFLEDAFDGNYRVAGFSQGKFSLQTDPDTGELVALRPRLGVETVGALGERDDALKIPLGRLLERANLTVGEER